MNDCNQPAFFLSLEEMQYQLFCLSSELKKNFFESKLDFLATFFFSIFLLLAMLEWQFLRLFSKPNILSTFFFLFSDDLYTLYSKNLVEDMSS